MRTLIKLFAFLLVTVTLFSGCEFIEHGKEAFVGNYTTEIDYTNSVIQLAIDLDADGDHDLTTNPPTTFSVVDTATSRTFIDTYFVNDDPASVVLQGSDSVKYTDSKRVLIGGVKEDSVLFASATMGTSPVTDIVTIYSTALNAKGKTISNDLYINYAILGTGSVSMSPYPIKYGIVKGIIKIRLRKNK